MKKSFALHRLAHEFAAVSWSITNKQQNNKILLITNIISYISFPPQIAYKLIEAGRSKNSLQIQGLSIDGLNNRENTTIQYIE